MSIFKDGIEDSAFIKIPVFTKVIMLLPRSSPLSHVIGKEVLDLET